MDKINLKHHLCAYGCCELVHIPDNKHSFLKYRCGRKDYFIGLSDCLNCSQFVDWHECCNGGGKNVQK